MNSLREPRKENVLGGPGLYVDSTCIDCDTCRWLQPNFFTRKGDQSAVYKQPQTREERLEALKAVTACPTGSIAMKEATPEERKIARDSFPLPIEGVENTYYLYGSRYTFGCAAYLVVRPNGESVMFDCPRFNEKLAKSIEKLTGVGGVKYLVMSHRDDVAGHDKWAKRLGCKRILHQADVSSSQKTDEVEIQLTDEAFGENGKGFWELDADGLKVISVRGHTRGSIALYDTKTLALFTGDHVMGRRITGRLGAGSRYNQDSWQRQIDNVAKLEEIEFRAVLPGHGRPMFWDNEKDRIQSVRMAVEDMKNENLSLVW